MRVLKSKVALLSLVVAGAFASTTATAAPLVLAATCPAALAKFAIELPPAAAAPFVVPPADTVQAPLGFGVAGGQRRFVRYDLAPGAKFGVALTSAALTAGTAFASTTLVQGGLVGDAYVVFEVEGTAVTGNVSTNVLSLAPGTITLPAASSATQTIAYSLHETAISASGVTASNATRLSNVGPCAIAEFVKSYDFTIANVNETVDAVAGFKKFTTAPDTALDIGGAITLGLVAAPPLVAATGVAVTLPNLFAAGTTIVVTSSDAAGFGALGTAGKFWESGAVCNATIGAPLATARTANSATFPVVATPGPNADVNTKFLCGVVDGTTIIPPQNLKAALVPGAGSGVGTAAINISNNVTTIVQNGAQLQSPWFSINPAVAAFFFLTNTSTLDMGYTSTIYCENGNTCTPGTGATGTIPAGKSVRVDVTGAAGVLASVSGPTRASVLFNIVGATGSVQGDLVVVNAANANQTTSSHMIRPGTN
jgi:hypothetical protein